MKVKASIKKRSEDCKIVRRKGRPLYHLQEESQVQDAPGLINV